MIWDQILGLDTAKKILRRALAESRVPPFYLIVGPKGCGKSLLVKTLISAAFCVKQTDEVCGECGPCRKFASGNHADYLCIEKDEDKQDLALEKLQGIHEWISRRAVEGGRKFLHIPQGDTLNLEGMNSLLKLLEEPPGRATFIIEASQRDKLLPTIQSRAQILTAPPLSEKELSAALAKKHPAQHIDFKLAVRFSRGSLGLAVKWMDESIQGEGKEGFLYSVRRSQEILLKTLDPAYGVWDLTAEWEDLLGGKTSIENRQAGLEILSSVRDYFRDLLLAREGAAPESRLHGNIETQIQEQSGKYDIWSALRALDEVIEYLDANGNVRIALETFVVRLRKSGRGIPTLSS